MLESRYFIEKELGHGGVGVVYLARDRKLLDKAVVVKILLEKSLRDDWTVSKFQQEKEALARVDHPGVVGILDTGELPNGKPYIVMQYVDGVSLRSAIPIEGMDLERAALIVKQTGAALNTVHEKGIYHRDLKPENIMLQILSSGEEQVKIVDFGIAKVKDSLLAPSTLIAATAGTIIYMSPEQLRGAKITAMSDIYAMGVIAYEMLTGRRPFNPETVAHLSDLQREGVRVKPKDLRPVLSEAAQNVILRALSFYPQHRQESARDFGDTLAFALVTELDMTFGLSSESTQVGAPFQPQVFGSAVSLATTQSGRRSRFSFWLNTSWLKVAVSFVFAAAFITAIFGVFTIQSRKSPPAERSSLANGNTNPPTTTGNVDFISTANVSTSTNSSFDVSSGRYLSYWLTVQKMRDGIPYQAPFQSSGQEIFETGYRFRLNISSPQAGFLYVFNEGASNSGTRDFSLIFPTPKENNGSASLKVGQSVQTGWAMFVGQPGTEQFWMVWSASPVAELEAARSAAFQSAGDLKDAALIRIVREFLIKNSAQKPDLTKNSYRRETVVRKFGDLLVNLVELEHR
ncbi:MAG TPA: protein kinase [Candidatus Binatia bacterium]